MAVKQSAEEITVQGQAMVDYLHRALAEANARIANLAGEKAILELRLSKWPIPSPAKEKK